MGWIFVKKNRAIADKTSFRICHECGERIYQGDAYITTHKSDWVFHPECGLKHQEEYLEKEATLSEKILEQITEFCEEVRREDEIKNL